MEKNKLTLYISIVQLLILICLIVVVFVLEARYGGLTHSDCEISYCESVTQENPILQS